MNPLDLKIKDGEFKRVLPYTLPFVLGSDLAATTTSTTNVDWVQDLGADRVIDYRTEDFATVVSGYDLVLDPVGQLVRRRAGRQVLRARAIALLSWRPTGRRCSGSWSSPRRR